MSLQAFTGPLRAVARAGSWIAAAGLVLAVPACSHGLATKIDSASQAASEAPAFSLAPAKAEEQFDLAMRYDSGNGVGADDAWAEYWAWRAALQGYAPARDWLRKRARAEPLDAIVVFDVLTRSKIEGSSIRAALAGPRRTRPGSRSRNPPRSAPAIVPGHSRASAARQRVGQIPRRRRARLRARGFGRSATVVRGGGRARQRARAGQPRSPLRRGARRPRGQRTSRALVSGRSESGIRSIGVDARMALRHGPGRRGKFDRSSALVFRRGRAGRRRRAGQPRILVRLRTWHARGSQRGGALVPEGSRARTGVRPISAWFALRHRPWGSARRGAGLTLVARRRPSGQRRRRGRHSPRGGTFPRPPHVCAAAVSRPSRRVLLGPYPTKDPPGRPEEHERRRRPTRGRHHPARESSVGRSETSGRLAGAIACEHQRRRRGPRAADEGPSHRALPSAVRSRKRSDALRGDRRGRASNERSGAPPLADRASLRAGGQKRARVR